MHKMHHKNEVRKLEKRHKCLSGFRPLHVRSGVGSFVNNDTVP